MKRPASSILLLAEDEAGGGRGGGARGTREGDADVRGVGPTSDE